MACGIGAVGCLIKRAVILLPRSPHYKREAFAEGLKSLGYMPVFENSADVQRGDVLVIWNRYRDGTAKEFEKAGAAVLVAENAWIGPESKEQHHFALCHGHHN